jgi:hypothetical protein
MSSIQAQIYEYYESNYEDLFGNNKAMIDKAISGIQEEFSKNIFPAMKVNWSSYPNHIGHLEFEGCFRCHNDRHSTEDGRVISMDCNLCHLIVAQGTPDTLQVSDIYNPLEFVHPNDEEGSWKEYMCSECHRELY